MRQKRLQRTFIGILVVFVLSVIVSMPKQITIPFLAGTPLHTIQRPSLNISIFGKKIQNTFDFRMGLDIQGGTRVTLESDMSKIDAQDRMNKLEGTRGVIARRVDLYGVGESVVKTSKVGEQYRIIVEIPGLSNTEEALSVIGTTALLDFREQATDEAAIASSSAFLTGDASQSASIASLFSNFVETGLTGKDLQRSRVQFSSQDGRPSVSLEFNEEGKKKFADITKRNVGKPVAIFLDGMPITIPTVNEPILTGEAVISGSYTVEEANNLSIQLNAGALPVPIKIVEQEMVGASLGTEAVQKTFLAGLIGIGLVMLFMILYYGWKGFLADLALLMYATITIALYKLIPVTLTLPGIAGLLLSIGMAVDSNILIFERMKEELRAGRPFQTAMELGFGRAWDSIKDANVATLFTCFILFNPFEFGFLNRSGMVRGFALTLALGIGIGLFTGIVVTRTLLRLFLVEHMRLSSIPFLKRRVEKSLAGKGKI